MLRELPTPDDAYAELMGAKKAELLGTERPEVSGPRRDIVLGRAAAFTREMQPTGKESLQVAPTVEESFTVPETAATQPVGDRLMRGALTPGAPVPFARPERTIKEPDNRTFKERFIGTADAGTISQGQPRSTAADIYIHPAAREKSLTGMPSEEADAVMSVAETFKVSPSVAARNFDEITRQVFPGRTPTNIELAMGLGQLPIAAALMGNPIIPVAAGLVLHPISIVAGLGAFMGLTELENGAVSIINQDEYKFGAGKGIKDLAPADLSRRSKTALDVLDFIGKGVLTGSLVKGFERTHLFYRLTNRERGLVLLDANEAMKNGMSEGEAIRMAMRRMTPEGRSEYLAQKVAERAGTPIPRPEVIKAAQQTKVVNDAIRRADTIIAKGKPPKPAVPAKPPVVEATPTVPISGTTVPTEGTTAPPTGDIPIPVVPETGRIPEQESVTAPEVAPAPAIAPPAAPESIISPETATTTPAAEIGATEGGKQAQGIVVKKTPLEIAHEWERKQRAAIAPADMGSWEGSTISNHVPVIQRMAKRLDKGGWQTIRELTPKNQKGIRNTRASARDLKDLRELGYARLAWDQEGNSYHAKATEPVPAWLTTIEDDAAVSALPTRAEVEAWGTPTVAENATVEPTGKPKRQAIVVPHPDGTGFAVSVGPNRWVSGGAGGAGGGSIGQWNTVDDAIAGTNHLKRTAWDVTVSDEAKTSVAPTVTKNIIGSRKVSIGGKRREHNIVVDSNNDWWLESKATRKGAPVSVIPYSMQEHETHLRRVAGSRKQFEGKRIVNAAVFKNYSALAAFLDSGIKNPDGSLAYHGELKDIFDNIVIIGGGKGFRKPYDVKQPNNLSRTMLAHFDRMKEIDPVRYENADVPTFIEDVRADWDKYLNGAYAGKTPEDVAREDQERLDNHGYTLAEARGQEENWLEQLGATPEDIQRFRDNNWSADSDSELTKDLYVRLGVDPDVYDWARKGGRLDEILKLDPAEIDTEAYRILEGDYADRPSNEYKAGEIKATPIITRDIPADRTTALVDMGNDRAGVDMPRGSVVYQIKNTRETVSEATYRNLTEQAEQAELGVEAEETIPAVIARPVAAKPTVPRDMMDTSYSVKEEPQQSMMAGLEGKIEGGLFGQKPAPLQGTETAPESTILPEGAPIAAEGKIVPPAGGAPTGYADVPEWTVAEQSGKTPVRWNNPAGATITAKSVTLKGGKRGRQFIVKVGETTYDYPTLEAAKQGAGEKLAEVFGAALKDINEGERGFAALGAEPEGETVIPASETPQPDGPSITPGPMTQNIIGLRTITPGLIRSEIIGNYFRNTVNIPVRKIGGRGMVTFDPLANAAFRERTRVKAPVESQSAIVGSEIENILGKVFEFDKQGRIPALSGVVPDVPGAPTIQDVAARLPLYTGSLTPNQMNALAAIHNMIQPYSDLLTEVGVDVSTRPDIMEGGFYLPRGRADIEGADAPMKIGAGFGRGTKKGFEKPTTFGSQAEGIESGYEYAPVDEVMSTFVFDAGMRATNQHIVNYFKGLTDETGKLVGETAKMRMMRLSPEVARKMESLNRKLDRLTRIRDTLTMRQQEVIDLWKGDPEYDDISELYDELLHELTPLVPKGRFVPQIGKYVKSKSPTAGMDKKQVDTLRHEVINDIRALRPEYKKALDKAKQIPREENMIGLTGMQGWTFPDEIANAANIILNQEGPTRGHLSYAVNFINAFNNLYRGTRATLDMSASAIQGLLGLGSQPAAWRKAFVIQAKAWGIHGDKILGQFLIDFDNMAVNTKRLTAAMWAKAGLRVGGEETEYKLGQGVGSKISNLPLIRNANRAFGYFGDAIRLMWADAELANQLQKRTLEEITASGDLERIAAGANVMTGWSQTKTGGSLGDLVFFAPRWLQSRFETVTKAARGLGPNAALDQHMARNALLRLIGYSVLLTVAANALRDKETDFRPMIRDKGSLTGWKRNSRFMRIEYRGHYYSLLGPWDSLLGLVINIGTGHPLRAARSISSGVVAMTWDVIVGRDYNYKPVNDSPASIAKWVGRSMVPFAWNDMPSDILAVYQGAKEKDVGMVAGGATNIVSQLVGVKSYPITATIELKSKWEDDLKTYESIPSNTDEATAKSGTTRLLYRQRNPEVDAKLFIIGSVGTVSTRDAKDAALRLIRENKLNPVDISGVQNNKKKSEKRRQLGLSGGEKTWTDVLVEELDAELAAPKEQQ